MTITSVALKPRPAGAAAETFRIRTTRFGELEIEDDLIIDMEDGLVGFERCRRYVVITPEEGGPFRWFQSLEDGGVAFPIIEPRQFKADYTPTLAEGDARRLGLSQDTQKLVFVVVTVPRSNPLAMTANLLAPLVINAETRRGRQVIVTDDRYTTRHSIVEELRSGSRNE